MKKLLLVVLAIAACLAPSVLQASDGKKGLIVFSGDYVIPQVVDGGGWKTAFTLVNISDKPASFTLAFTDDNGKPMPMTFPGFPPNATSINFTNLPVLGSVSLESTGIAPTTTQGWAGITVPDDNTLVAGSAVFKRSIPGLINAEAVVPLSSIYDFRQAMPFDNTNGYLQGVALANSSTTDSVTVTFSFKDLTGSPFFQDTVTLAPSSHTAFLVSTKWPLTANRRGTMDISTPELPSPGTGVSIVGLRGTPAGGLSTVFPMVSPSW